MPGLWRHDVGDRGGSPRTVILAPADGPSARPAAGRSRASPSRSRDTRSSASLVGEGWGSSPWRGGRSDDCPDRAQDGHPRHRGDTRGYRRSSSARPGSCSTSTTLTSSVAFDVGDSTGYLYFAMEYVPGRDAHHVVREAGGPLPVGRAVRLICQMLDALDLCPCPAIRPSRHQAAQPSDTRVYGAEESSKLADFGLARVYQSSRLSGLTITGDVQGTPAFMPPEQITRYRDVLPTSDLYSAGATLYYLLTRKYVYDFPKRVELRILKILEEDPVPIRSRRADLPAPLADIIDRCLAREPEDRFPDAESLHEALKPFLRSKA